MFELLDLNCQISFQYSEYRVGGSSLVIISSCGAQSADCVIFSQHQVQLMADRLRRSVRTDADTASPAHSEEKFSRRRTGVVR